MACDALDCCPTREATARQANCVHHNTIKAYGSCAHLTCCLGVALMQAGAYQRIGESTEVALRVLAEKARPLMSTKPVHGPQAGIVFAAHVEPHAHLRDRPTVLSVPAVVKRLDSRGLGSLTLSRRDWRTISSC
jgi:hypothetical protein